MQHLFLCRVPMGEGRLGKHIRPAAFGVLVGPTGSRAAVSVFGTESVAGVG